MDNLTYIETKYKKNDFQKVKKELEKYMLHHINGIYDELYDMYIKSLIKLGLFDEALKNIEIMQKYFPHFYSQFTLAERYASCSEKEKLEKILECNQFVNEEYYIIARICFYNGNISFAKKLFEKLLGLNYVEKKQKIEEYLKKIRLFESSSETLFQCQAYSYFKNCGYTLEPGHVIYIDKLYWDYYENFVNDDPKKNERPYMIWKIENDLLYAFPITTQLNKYLYTFYSQDYKQHPDRTLKDRLAVIKECDVTVVDDKINEKDLEQAISAMYRSIYFSYQGEYSINVEYFMNEMLKSKHANIGDVIVINDFKVQKIKFYFVSDIDDINEKYKVFEIDHSFKPEGDYLRLGYIDFNMPILNTFSFYEECIKQELLDLKPSTFAFDSMVGLIFDFDKRKLEILEETSDSYVCMDITNGYIPETIEIVFIHKNISIFNIVRVPEEILKEQQKLFDEYKENNMEEFIIRSEEFKRVLKKED